jgi:hypothetical protein
MNKKEREIITVIQSYLLEGEGFRAKRYGLITWIIFRIQDLKISMTVLESESCFKQIATCFKRSSEFADDLPHVRLERMYLQIIMALKNYLINLLTVNIDRNACRAVCC